jgi:hypothetical protein
LSILSRSSKVSCSSENKAFALLRPSEDNAQITVRPLATVGDENASPALPPPGRLAETGANIQGQLSSPELQPPK